MKILSIFIDSCMAKHHKILKLVYFKQIPIIEWIICLEIPRGKEKMNV